MKILRDEEFIRGKTPMTKYNVRALSMTRFSIRNGDTFLDIGCGTGSISVQAALFGAKVTAVDMSEEAVSLTKENALKHDVELETILGKAPECLSGRCFDHCFVGGTGHVIPKILDYLTLHLKSGGEVVANFILISNLNEFIVEIKKRSFEELNVTLVQTAEMKENGLFSGENPIYIVSAKKK